MKKRRRIVAWEFMPHWGMGVRLMLLAGLVAVIFMGTQQRPARAQRANATTIKPPVSTPPPMFSPWYAEALRDILSLEPSDTIKLERKLAADPENSPVRLQLLAYYKRADRATYPESLAQRVRHALWLVEHHPESELLHSPFAQFSTGELAPAQYRRAVALWNAAAKSRPRDAAVQWNAASFFRDLDPLLYLQYLEATAAADPNHPFALRPLADLYAISLLNPGPLTARAQLGLDASKNVWVLGNAAYMLQSQYNQTVQSGRPNRVAAELAERYFLRAQAIAPNLDRATVLPQLDLAAIARARQAESRAQADWASRAETAARNIHRLNVSSFPDLPPAIAEVLRQRNCQVPQISSGGPPRNVVVGEFFAKGEIGWAALCSVKQVTSLLVFRNAFDRKPQTLSTSEDRTFLQGLDQDKIGYSRNITPVGRDFIVKHYRAYGGPEPPSIDHQGIDDAFVGKASSTWYFHNGKWLRLQGAD